jgi:uncharacterized hydrophobic protein (TIGR00271 family)
MSQDKSEDKSKPVLFSSFFEQRKTIETLLEESRADGDYYLLLAISVFITSLGLIYDNIIVVVGAMLIAPILFPVLALGMGVVTAGRESIKRSLRILAISIFGGAALSFLTAFLFNYSESSELILLMSEPNIAFFFVAFFSGVVASYSWVKQSISSTLPGVAITVSLVPPLSALGVSLALLSRDVFSGAFFILVINLFGIVLAASVTFSLFGFSRLARFEQRKIEEEKEEVIAEHSKIE